MNECQPLPGLAPLPQRAPLSSRVDTSSITTDAVPLLCRVKFCVTVALAQGLTLDRFSAQLERFVRDRGCA